MPEALGAAGQLERILYILPRAAREGGASLAEISESLGVEIPVVLKDLKFAGPAINRSRRLWRGRFLAGLSVQSPGRS